MTSFILPAFFILLIVGSVWGTIHLEKRGYQKRLTHLRLRRANTSDPAKIAQYVLTNSDLARKTLNKILPYSGESLQAHRADLYDLARTMQFTAGNLRLLDAPLCRQTAADIEALVQLLLVKPSDYLTHKDRDRCLDRADTIARSYLGDAGSPA